MLTGGGIGPSPESNVTITPFDGERGRIVGVRCQFPERPAQRLGRGVSNVEQRRLLAGSESHIELLEGERETFTTCFDVGFFARPAVKKGFRLQMLRQGAKRFDFTRREKAFRYVLARKPRANVFEVDADFPPAREGVERQPVGMRDAEAQSVSAKLRRQGWLSERAVAKLQFGGRRVE